MITLNKFLLFIIVCCLVYIFFMLGMQDNFTLESLRLNTDLMQQFYHTHRVVVIVGYGLVYVASMALMLPVSIVLNLAAGVIFGAWTGTLIATVFKTIGSAASFFLARFIFRHALENRFGNYTHKLNVGITANPIGHVMFLRFIHIFPSVIINVCLGFTRLHFGHFLLGSLIGFIPGTFVYANAGSQLFRIQSFSQILSWKILSAFLLLAVFSVIPTVYAFLKSKKARATPF